MKNKIGLEKFQINSRFSLTKALFRMNKYGFKSLIVVDDNKKYLGIISDGDIRKSILKRKSIFFKIESIFKRKSIFFRYGKYKIETIKSNFLKKKIDIIPILNSSNRISKVYFYSDVVKLNKSKKKSFKKILNTEVFIMSGGKGTRLKPYTNILPKPLIPYKGSTIIENIISQFNKYNIKDYTFSINYKSHVIKAYFKEIKLPFNINYLEETKPLGTVGSLSLIQNQKHKNYFISNCDTIIYSDLSKIFNHHIRKKNYITIVVTKINYKLPYGTCYINRKLELESFLEKPETKYIINTGLYLIKSDLIKIIPKHRFFDMTDLINKAKKKGLKVGVYLIDKKDWLDLGSIKKIAYAE